MKLNVSKGVSYKKEQKIILCSLINEINADPQRMSDETRSRLYSFVIMKGSRILREITKKIYVDAQKIGD